MCSKNIRISILVILILAILIVIFKNQIMIFWEEKIYSKIPWLVKYELQIFEKTLRKLSNNINKNYRNILIVGACFPRMYIGTRHVYPDAHITLIDLDEERLEASKKYLRENNYPIYHTIFKHEKCCQDIKDNEYDLIIITMDFVTDASNKFCLADIIRQEDLITTYRNNPTLKVYMHIGTYLNYYDKDHCRKIFD